MPKSDNPVVQFRSDGLGLSPAEYARLLAEIAERRGIDVDDYSRGGVVAELEERMAALLGKETAVFLPTGTLANHLAVRLLAEGRGRRVLVQQESHLWNDEGDCATHLSGLTLVPLAPGRATITLGRNRAGGRRRAGDAGRGAGRRDLDRDAGAPRRRRGLRSGRIARDLGLCPRARHRAASRRRAAADRSGLYRDRPGRYGGAVRYGLCVAVEIPERGIGRDPGRAARACSTGSTTSAACSAAACRMPGPMRRWRCISSTGSPSVSPKRSRSPGG